MADPNHPVPDSPEPPPMPPTDVPEPPIADPPAPHKPPAPVTALHARRRVVMFH
jgi:hypothetical protein